MNRRAHVFLTGGLGNQLFQVAAAKAHYPGATILLHGGLGNPRLNSSGTPEIIEYDLGPDVEFTKTHKNLFVEKTLGYTLRTHINFKGAGKFFASRFVIRILASIVLSVFLKKPLSVRVNIGVGYSKLRKPWTKEIVAIGYFQTYRFASDFEVSAYLKKLSPLHISGELESYRKVAETEQPLIVHFRFGDYLQEDGFGIPTTDYYDAAIGELWNTGGFKKIWVFSDEPGRVPATLIGKYDKFLRWIPMIANSSTQTLEVMRLGHGYVIANSTFSWWGAFLSRNNPSLVVAPSPWFKRVENPTDITPDNWKNRNAF